MSAVRAFGSRRTNADLIVDLDRLGLLRGRVLDATYGLGRFWAQHRPPGLVTLDLDPTRRSMLVGDFTRLPFADRSFGTVLLDPPYKLNGTSNQGGPATSDDDYGVGGEYRSIAQRHQLIFDGMTECGRVADEILIVKCQDQVCSGDIQWQTDLIRDHAINIGWVKLDQLHVGGYRAQPERTRKHKPCKGEGCDGCGGTGREKSVQQHAGRDYSTALVFERGKPASRHRLPDRWTITYQTAAPPETMSPEHVMIDM